MAKLRTEFYGHPWAILPQTLGAIGEAIEAGESESIRDLLSMGGFDEPDQGDEVRIVNGVAVLPVTGVLRDGVDYMVRWGGASSYQRLEKQVKSLVTNEQVTAIILYCDSPGGSAVGVKRLADAISGLRGTKPIWSYVQGMCCSAAYYLASATDRIEATSDSLVGSIGTIYPQQEMSNYLKGLGVQVTVFTNKDSPKKGHGNVYEPLTPEARETLQKFVDSYGESFISDVAQFRGVSEELVKASFGQGDAMRADIAIRNGLVDAISPGFESTLSAIRSGSKPQGVTNQSAQKTNPQSSSVLVDGFPVAAGPFFATEVSEMKFSKKIRAQLFALGLIETPDASDETCTAALTAWFRGSVPQDETAVLNGLRSQESTVDSEDEESEEETKGESSENAADTTTRQNPVQEAHAREQREAKFADLRASAKAINRVAGSDVITAEMVLDACEGGLTVQQATMAWGKTLESKEPAVPAARVNHTGDGSQRFAADAVSALLFNAMDGSQEVQLSGGAQDLVGLPLWAIAGRCLEAAGQHVDMYGDKELIASEAMSMNYSPNHQVMYGENESRRYVQASSPANRPGDFPNILSGLANKYLDMIELDDDYSYPEISAVLPGGLRDFKPGLLINKGIVEEMDEVEDAEQFNELGLAEEVLSYIFIQRFGNKWGWTPAMIANDDMGAFVEGMLGLREAWEVTQNRLVLDKVASNVSLLDGNALFSNRADTGNGTIPAANNNDRTSGGVPSDSEWGSMSTLYAGIGGVNTGRRVRGTLNTILVPTNNIHQEAVRTFETYPVIGESKQAATTSNLGIYRNKVKVVPESELNSYHATRYYGFRSPTRLNTATVVRGYFAGFGTGGRRERWYDPENKTTYVSLEGRIAVAVKNWRYAVRNKGAA